MSRSSGFTLIELLVVISITAILAAITVPLGSTWVSGAKLSQVDGSVTQAIWKARSVSMRNQYMASGVEPVGTICITETALSVRERDTTGSADCGDPPTGNLVWTEKKSEDVSITSSDSEEVTCICFSNSGLLTTAGSCSSCLNDSTVELVVGSRNESIYIY